MKLSPSICIDLGAAFTKIAARSKPKETSLLLTDQGQDEEYQICIPSLAANRVGTDAWAFGWEVLDYEESETIKLHQNWKSHLFDGEKLDRYFDLSDDDEAQRFLMANDPHYQSLACCREFLKSIKQDLIPLLLGQHRQFKKLVVEEFDTYICVPDFALNSHAGTTIEHLMENAGFTNHGNFCISEPKASLIGILTEGQNHVNRNHTPNISFMFRELDLLKKLTVEEDSILFLDVGAFTADFALTNLHRDKADVLDESPSASHPLGIFKLDEMVQAAAGPEFRDLLNNAAPIFREHYHQQAYSEDFDSEADGQTVHLRDGTEINRGIIDQCIDEFTRTIINTCRSFLQEHNKGNIYAAVLTGGGSMCSRITSRIAEGVSEFDIPIIRAHRDANTKNLDPIAKELVRGSSAIGGTSVLYAFRE